MKRFSCEPAWRSHPVGRHSEAISAIKQYTPALASEDPLQAEMAIDAVKYHFVVIGEAVGSLDASTRARAPEVPWPAIKRLRNILAHEYFHVSVLLIREIVEGDDLVALEQAVKALLADSS